MTQFSSSRGYIGMFMILVGCAVVAGLYFMSATTSKDPDQVGQSNSDANIQLVQEAKKIRAAAEVRNAQYQEALNQ